MNDLLLFNYPTIFKNTKENIKKLKRTRADIKEDTEILQNKYIDSFIEENEEKIYFYYCDIYPENITSDFFLEDIEDIEDFINNYIREDFNSYIEKEVIKNAV